MATDHEEVLAFLLGQLVKDKARYHTLRDGVSPSSVSIKLTEFEERVSPFLCLPTTLPVRSTDDRMRCQAKGLEIYDVNAFTRSQLFKTNGYKRTGENIVKSFSDEI